MISQLLALWRTLSLIFFVVAGALLWHSVSLFQDASAASRPVAADQKSTERIVAIEDSLVFDLQRAGLGQDNIMGWKGEEYAVIPAHPIGDTSRTLIVISSSPTHMGPVINEFLKHQSASLDDHNISVQSSEKDAGTAKLQARALIQVLAEKFKDNLNDSTRRREVVRGVAHLKNAAEFPQVSGLEGELLAIRAGYLPGMGSFAAFAGGGLLLLLLNIATWVWERRRRQQAIELEENTPPAAPLV
ncbi:MAG: hypothetical protein RL318_897 [Fibrobacterota bacterium]|jgi:hypothetical protein